MKKVKIAFWVLLIAFFVLLIYQNQDVFLGKNGLGINLYFFQYHIPELHNAVYYLAFFIIGFLCSYFMALSDRYKSNKTIKELKSTADTQLQRIMELQAQTGGGNKPPADQGSQALETVS